MQSTKFTPNPSLWVLRFKQHKTTILLYVQPTESFTVIKSDLLTALKKRNLTTLNGQSIPKNPEDVIFGVPVDRNDVSKGWVPLEIPPEDLEEMTGTSGGNKAGRGGKKGGKSVLNESPAGAGLKDGGMVAFRFGKDKEENADGGMDLEEEEFDVVMPIYEYADEVGSEA
ncbi:MAG: hypothetical protein MMC33_010715 [Icmadophila ericetorum]|nr:hypothetical protein [Icmadophila ericetorum]